MIARHICDNFGIAVRLESATKEHMMCDYDLITTSELMWVYLTSIHTLKNSEVVS